MERTDGGRFFRVMEKVTDLVVLGLLWLVTSLPVLTLGTSCAALYEAVERTIRFEDGKPVKVYFQAWKAYAMRGCAGTAVYLVLGAALAGVMMTGGEEIRWAGMIPVLVLAASAVYFFPVMVGFRLSVGQCFQAALFLVVRHAGRTALLVGTLGLCGAVVGFMPFLLPVVAAGYAFYASVVLERVWGYYSDST
ncbi:MAG: DUF624 domain-containing protein [Eubacteriales bacterium]|nr:DUF624 domain-containing protein [Eubacteriales bacterium]